MAHRVLSGFPDVLPRGEALGNPVRADLCAQPCPYALEQFLVAPPLTHRRYQSLVV